MTEKRTVDGICETCGRRLPGDLNDQARAEAQALRAEIENAIRDNTRTLRGLLCRIDRLDPPKLTEHKGPRTKAEWKEHFRKRRI